MAILLFALLSTNDYISLAEDDCDGSVSDCIGDFNSQDHEEDDEDLSNNDDDEREEAPVASDGDQDEQQIGQTNRSLFLDFLRMVAALVLVLALIFVVLKFVQKRTRIYQQTQSLENVGGIALGNNKSAQVVRVGNEYYLLGVGDNVEMLTKVDDEETIEQLAQSHEDTSSNISFQSVLQNFQNRNRNPYQEQETKNQFKTELETMKNSRKRMMKRYQDKDGPTDE
ncbi:flagellar biosynthetic protein FliO [Alkalibacillus haloalkaliphilus]|uniref:flagellar biosynthetic protein FliO n=1 Tax=Alkalibacillus haloalkaliphilus TaxID=94136 RepID=UPI002935DBC1|nr:flagellar biosynthetic protein FliO [Alkalibacillus haloalkaliphilus]MDV2580612.1 flagellar biosynthetic protein FliO [Alkalibacillus haloalkaliphilus]